MEIKPAGAIFGAAAVGTRRVDLSEPLLKKLSEKCWFGEWRDPKPGELSADYLKQIAIYPEPIRQFLMQVRDTHSGLDNNRLMTTAPMIIQNMVVAHVAGKIIELIDKLDKHLEARDDNTILR